MTKTTLISVIAGACLSAASFAAEPPSPNPATPQPSPEAAAQPSTQTGPAPEDGAPATNSVLAALPPESAATGLRLNFRGAPLSLVLDYMSDAAGFIINKEAEVRGTVDVWSKEPVTKEEAVDLLNSVLRKNGYAVIRNGRILTIVSLDSAKTADLDIQQGSKWEDVEKGDEVITQIIPVRYANATQMMNNLQVLLPTTATMSVNESANSLILVATKTDIRRMLRIVNALDTSIASVSSIKVFPLKYADAKQLATVVQQLFTTQASGQGMNPRAQLFNMFGGGRFGGGPGGPPGMPGSSGGSSGGGSKVNAAADDYSNSLIVSASSEVMATITDMVEQIDQPASDVTEVRVFHLVNADATELADQIAQLFPDETRTGSGNQGGGGFRFFGGARFGGAASQSGSSDRMKKKGKVIAVPDPRTSSLLVSAASELMPQLAEMIERLDNNAGKKEVVRVFDIQNANITDVNQIMQDLFNRNNTMRSSSSSSRSMVGQGNPLLQRQTQQQLNTSRNSGFGNTGRSSGGGF